MTILQANEKYANPAEEVKPELLTLFRLVHALYTYLPSRAEPSNRQNGQIQRNIFSIPLDRGRGESIPQCPDLWAGALTTIPPGKYNFSRYR